MKLLFRNSKLLPILFFTAISTLLIISWFKDGLIYGGGDVGLPAYNPKRIFEITRFIWWESAAPGYPVPQGLTSAPFVFLLTVLQSLGFSPLMLQASLFLLLNFFMGIGMYLLAIHFFGKDKKQYAILAGIFYMFNPYTMIQIWHRFVHTAIFLAAFLPFFIIFWRKWIINKDPKYLLYFLLTNFAGVYIYGTIAFILSVWFVLFFITLLDICFPWKNLKYFYKVGLLFITGFILWLFINSWWLVPTFTVGSGLFSEQHNTKESLVTLLEISRQEVLPFTLQMINPFYLYESAELGDIYKTYLFRIIPWIFVGVILFGLYRSLKSKKIISIGIIFLVIIFFSKGTASPFGFFYRILFDNFFIFGVIRNPFEKIGILLPVFASLLLVFGLQTQKKSWKQTVLSLSIVGLLLIFAWPMILGTIFGRMGNPPYVKIPESYISTNKWIAEQNKTGRILHLPLSHQEGVSYNWEYGYNGVDPSSLVFTSNPSISRGFNLRPIDDTLTALSLSFDPTKPDKDKILNLLQSFEVRFIVLHKDIKWQGGELLNPQDVEKSLNDLKFLEKKAEFGDLSIYELAENYFQPKFILSNQIVTVSPSKADSYIWINENSLPIISSLQDKQADQILDESSKEKIILPDRSFSYPEGSSSADLQYLASQLLFSQNLTINSPINILLLTKNHLSELKASLNVMSVADEIIKASQELADMVRFSESQNVDNNIVSSYVEEINNIFVRDSKELELYYFLKEMDDIFELHLYLAQKLEPKLSFEYQQKIEQSTKLIKKYLESKRKLPKFSFLGNINNVNKRQIFDFWIPQDGKYELLMDSSKIQNSYSNNLEKVDFQINDKLISLPSSNSNNWLSFGEIELKKGLNEISYSNPPSVNLVEDFTKGKRNGEVKMLDNSTLEITSNNALPAFFESEELAVSGQNSYYIKFDAQNLSSSQAYLAILQDTDRIENGIENPRIIFTLPPNNGSWLSYSLTSNPVSLTTKKVRFAFIVNQGTVRVKNLRVVRVLNNNIFFKKEGRSASNFISDQMVQYKQENPIYYQGSFKVTAPSFFIFKESFHPGWKLKLTKDGQNFTSSKQYLAYFYGNAWYIKDTGMYKFTLEFEPQNNVNKGLYLSLGLILFITGWVVKRKYEKK